MTKKTRLSAAALVLLSVLALLLSTVYILAHAEHDCAGEDCPVCAQLCACAQNFKGFAAASGLVSAAAVFTLVRRIGSGGRAAVYLPSTPVLLKVKLSD